MPRLTFPASHYARTKLPDKPLCMQAKARKRQRVLDCATACGNLSRLLHHLPWTHLSAAEKQRLGMALKALESDVSLARAITKNAASTSG